MKRLLLVLVFLVFTVFLTFLSLHLVQRCSGIELSKVMSNKHEAVDLGLSVKWATCNVGANRPEEYGGYYAWGETNEKSEYLWSNYKWVNFKKSLITKYCSDSWEGKDDDKITLELSDDVAYVKWGGKWRMPTSEELAELMDCDVEWTSVNGVAGCRMIGPNGNSIFLPAAGYRKGTDFYNRGSSGCYYSATRDERFGNFNISFFLFYDENWGWDNNGKRFLGLTVRPVID